MIICSIAALSTSPEKPAGNVAEDSSYLLMLDSIDAYINEEAWEKAEIATEKALRAKPGNAINMMLLTNLANIKLSLEKYDEAVTLSDVVLSRAPESSRLLNLKGKTLIAAGRMDEAIAPLEKSLRNDTSQIWTNEMLGALYLAKREDSKGLLCYRRLHNLQPDNPDYLKPIAGIMLKHNNLHEAEKLYQMILELNEDEETYTNLTSILLLEEKIEEAEKCVRAALEKYPENGNLYALRSVIYRNQYQTSEAEAAINLAKKYNADPQFIDLFYSKKAK